MVLPAPAALKPIAHSTLKSVACEEAYVLCYNVFLYDIYGIIHEVCSLTLVFILYV